MDRSSYSDPGAERPARVGGRGPNRRGITRQVSLPSARPRRGILKVSTLDESLHSTWESSNQVPKTVNWKDVEIREYERTVGDNPSCSSGPPLAIGWRFAQRGKTTVDWYEEARPPRKSQFEMVLPREERQDMLVVDWRVSQTQIATAIRENIKAKNQRRRTVNNLGRFNALEEMLESFIRKLVRLFTFQKRTSKQVTDLNKKAQMAADQRKMIEEERARQENKPDIAPMFAQVPEDHRNQIIEVTQFPNEGGILSAPSFGDVLSVESRSQNAYGDQSPNMNMNMNRQGARRPHAEAPMDSREQNAYPRQLPNESGHSAASFADASMDSRVHDIYGGQSSGKSKRNRSGYRTDGSVDSRAQSGFHGQYPSEGGRSTDTSIDSRGQDVHQGRSSSRSRRNRSGSLDDRGQNAYPGQNPSESGRSSAVSLPDFSMDLRGQSGHSRRHSSSKSKRSAAASYSDPPTDPRGQNPYPMQYPNEDGRNSVESYPDVAMYSREQNTFSGQYPSEGGRSSATSLPDFSMDLRGQNTNSSSRSSSRSKRSGAGSYGDVPTNSRGQSSYPSRSPGKSRQSSPSSFADASLDSRGYLGQSPMDEQYHNGQPFPDNFPRRNNNTSPPQHSYSSRQRREPRIHEEQAFDPFGINS